mmetsp:Transcript_3729/g.8513  ORF Transcript_3729/g.8513 Transcript_3729/m.8513 type:complete len:115 (+) Transcript_3729:45-389(+)
MYWPRCPRECRVYVGNIRFGTRWDDVREHMSKGGQVVFGRIIKQAREDPNSPSGVRYVSRGFAIVQYATPEDATKAIETLSGTTLNGRRIYVRPDESRRGATKGATDAETPAEE